MKLVSSSFKINDKSYSISELNEYAKNCTISTDDETIKIGRFLLEWLSDKNYIIAKTSGSTRLPKEIKLFKKHMINSALATNNFFKLSNNSKVLNCLSISYIAGKMMLVRALVCGYNIHFVNPSNNPLKNLNTKFDFCAMIPLQVKSSIKNLNIIKTLLIGGSAINQSLIDKLESVKTKCFATYGMTETVSHIAVKSLNVNPEKYYTVLPNVSISQDDRKCLVIDAKNVSVKKVITNDVVKLHSNKQFEYIGRIDNVINSGGIKFFPEKLEEKLSNFINVNYFISSEKDDKLGEKIILIIESKEEINIDFSALDKYEIPKKIYHLDSFNYTKSKKINRKKTLLFLSFKS